jgi:hypothetical protein
MTPETITAIATAVLGVGGLAGIMPKVIEGITAWRSGRAASEKGRNQTLLARLAAAETRAETEAEFRRIIEEYAGRLRLMLIHAGVTEDRIPPWPVRNLSKKG